jgi:hypothetical protein
MRKALFVFCVVAFAGLFIGLNSAHAQTTFILQGTGTNVSFDLTLTTVPDNNGQTPNGATLSSPLYEATGISGTITEGLNTYTVTGLEPQTTLGAETTIHGVPNSGGADDIYDNLLSASSPFLDNDGISFTTTGGDPINIFSQPIDFVDFGNGAAQITGLSTLTLTETPEPASMLLFGTGLLAMGFVTRKRFLA